MNEISYPLADQAFCEQFPLPADYAISPAGVQRNFQLASVLEPLVIHPDKTTPQADLSAEQRLSFFLAAGVNSGEAIRTLAGRLHEAKNCTNAQPLLYDTLYVAQIDSRRQRAGGRINHGIIAMMIPIIASQVLYLEELPTPNNMEQVFSGVERVLANTTDEDVSWLRRAESLSYELSHHEGRGQEPWLYAGKTVLKYYQARSDGLSQYGQDNYYNEFLTNFRTTQSIIARALGVTAWRSAAKFQDIFSDACTTLMAERSTPYEGGLMADNVAVALYMCLSHHPEAKVIF